MSVVLAIPDEFWTAHTALNNEVVEIGLRLKIFSETLNDELLPALKRFQFR